MNIAAPEVNKTDRDTTLIMTGVIVGGVLIGLLALNAQMPLLQAVQAWFGSEKGNPSEVIRNYGLIIAGGIGLCFAWWRADTANKENQNTIEALEIEKKGRLDERFKVGAEMLGSDSPGQQFGGAAILRNLVTGSDGTYAIETFELAMEMLESSSARWHESSNRDWQFEAEKLAAQSERANLERLNNQLVSVVSRANQMTERTPAGTQTTVRRYAQNIVLNNASILEGSLAGVNFRSLHSDQCGFFRVSLASTNMYNIVGTMEISQCKVMDACFAWNAKRNRSQRTAGVFKYTTGPRLRVFADFNSISMNCCELTQAHTQCREYVGTGNYFVEHAPTIYMQTGFAAVAKVDRPPNNKTAKTFEQDWKSGTIFFYDKDNPEGWQASPKELEKYYAGRSGPMRM